jgi:hypothetical protein
LIRCKLIKSFNQLIEEVKMARFEEQIYVVEDRFEEVVSNIKEIVPILKAAGYSRRMAKLAIYYYLSCAIHFQLMPRLGQQTEEDLINNWLNLHYYP